jgi:hypothetical protein
VGGFGASDWLYSELKARLKFQGLDVSRPDSHVCVTHHLIYQTTLISWHRNKAVADGAVSFYLDHFVSVRVSKHTYGLECVTAYVSDDAEHRARLKSAVKDAAGDLMIPKMFSPILLKVGTRFFFSAPHMLSVSRIFLYQKHGSIGKATGS